MCFWFPGTAKRTKKKARMVFSATEIERTEICAKLDEKGIPYTVKNQYLRLAVDKQMIEANAALFTEIAKLVRQSWKL